MWVRQQVALTVTGIGAMKMSWENKLKKARFRGPPKEYAKWEAEQKQLGLALKVIHRYVKEGMKRLEKVEVVDDNHLPLRQAMGMLDLAIEEIDKIDEKMLERAKYVERDDERYIDYAGAKFPNER